MTKGEKELDRQVSLRSDLLREAILNHVLYNRAMGLPDPYKKAEVRGRKAYLMPEDDPNHSEEYVLLAITIPKKQ